MAIRKKPYQGDSHALLTQYINKANNSELVEGIDFTYGIPYKNHVGSKRNSQVKLFSKNRYRFKDTVVNYNRIPISVLSKLSGSEVLPVPILAIPFSIHSILAQINDALGLNLEPNEVENTVYIEKADTYTLRVNTQSLRWLESSFDFKAALDPNIPTEPWNN